MVPNGWKHKAFGDVVKLSKNKYDPQKSDKCFPCVELEHLTQETGQIVGSTPASTLGSIKNQFNSGDVIFGKLRPYLKKYAMPNFDGVCSSEIWVFAPTKEIINPYLYQFVQTNTFITEANKSAGSKMPRADWEVVSEMQLPLPPLPEQRKIAKILSTWDKAIATTERLIATSQQQKKALMQQLLTGKKRLVNPETGMVFEGDWEEVKLGDISAPQQWSTISSKELLDDGFPVYGANGHIGYFSEYNHEFETVAVTCRGSTCGEVSLIPERSYITGNAMCLDNINEEAHSYKFVFYALCYRGFKDVISGSAQPQIVGKAIKAVKFAVPALAEQQKIASVLTAADKEIELLETKLAHLKEEKKALMQQLLTGKRRVKVDTTEAA